MANPTVGFGLRPIRRIDGASLSFQLMERQIAYNYGTKIYTGDLAQPLTTGYVSRYAAGQAITCGVFWGCKYLNPSTGRVEWFQSWSAPTLPSTTIVYCYLINDPRIVFNIRNSSAANAVTIADMGDNADITATAGSDSTGQSKEVLDQASLANTATFPLRIVGLGPAGLNNDNTIGNNIVEVILNSSDMALTTGLH